MADVLLHEQIHQWHQKVTGISEESHHGHGPAIRDVANRIGSKLGMPSVRSAKKRGPDKDLPSCAQWPHCVQPDGFYGTYLDGVPNRRPSSRICGSGLSGRGACPANRLR